MAGIALVSLCLAFWWTFMILMVLLTGYYRQWQTERRFRQIPLFEGDPPRCLLLRPCSGEDAQQFTCLTSIIDAKRSFPLEVIIGVDSEEDPAFPNAIKAVETLNRHGIESAVRITPQAGPNGKVSILAGCMAAAKSNPDIIISADSNTDLTGFDLNRFVTPLCRDDNVSAIWAPPWVSAAERGWGNIASEAVLHVSWHSFGLLGAVSPGGMIGKLFAVKQEALSRIGGFEAMIRYLGEDMEMSKRLRRLGKRVDRFPTSVRTTAKRARWADTLARHMRWMMVIKAQRRAFMSSFPLLFFNALIVYFLAIIGLWHSLIAGGVSLLAAFLLRFLVGYSAARMLGLTPGLRQLLAYAVIADVLLLSAFVRVVKLRRIAWRGKELTFAPNGELETVFRKP